MEEELKDKAFRMLDEDESFIATAGAVYNYGYSSGKEQGLKQGERLGRSYLWHWSFPFTLLVVGFGGILVGASLVTGWIAMGVL